MNRRKEIVIACASIGLSIGMLTIIAWSVSADLNHHSPPGPVAVLGLCFSMAGLGALGGVLRRLRYRHDEPALLSYGPFRICLVMMGPLIVVALGIGAHLKVVDAKQPAIPGTTTIGDP